MKKMMMTLVIVLTMLCSTIFSSAAADPAVTIVNPTDGAQVYSDSLLISVKVTQPKTIRISVFEKKQTVDGIKVPLDVNKLVSGTTTSAMELIKNSTEVEACISEKFTCTNNLSFFTKQVNSLSPGMYVVKVETLDSTGKVVASSSTTMALMGKMSAEDKAKIIDTPQNSALQFFQNLFKSIFN